MDRQELSLAKGFKTGDISFRPPVDYLDRFINITEQSIWKGGEMDIRIMNPITNMNEDETENTSYGRFMVMVKPPVPKKAVSQFPYPALPTAGLLMAFDTKPVIKTFFGVQVTACLNMSIFRPEHVSISFLTDTNREKPFNELENWCQNSQNLVDQYNKMMEIMIDTKVPKDSLYDFFGRMIVKSSSWKDVGRESVLRGLDNVLIDKKSVYFGKNTLDDLYNAMTFGTIDQKNFINYPNKNLGMFEILKATAEDAKLITLN